MWCAACRRPAQRGARPVSLATLLAKVLIVGHSLVGPDLPAMVEGGLEAAGVPASVEAQVINGAPLRWSRERAAEAEGANGPERLAAGDVDVLVLTEAIPLANHLEWSGSAAEVTAWASLAWAANPAAQVYVYETWHDLRSGSGAPVEHDAGAAQPWADRIAADRAVWWSLAAAANAARPEGTPPVRLIPAGQAMARVAAAAERGTIPGLSGAADLFADTIHPSGRGLYVVALTHAAVIGGLAPESLPDRLGRRWLDREAVISPEMGAAIRREVAAALADWRAEEERLLAAAPRAAAAPAPAGAPAPTPAAAPAGPDPAIAALGGVDNPNLGLGLAPVVDWSVQQPFLNVIKTARPWVGHLPGQWGGYEAAALSADGHVGRDGWPARMPAGVTGLSTLVLTDLPEGTGGVAGRYVLTWTGQGELRAEGRAQLVEAAPGRILFEYTPGPGGVILTLASINPADPPRDMVLVRADRAAALAAGAVFNPDWLARLRGARMIRFMDWMATNDSRLSSLPDRPLPGDFTWAARGVPVEVMVALANELNADPWFCIPHLTEDPLVAAMAQAVRDGLAPGLRAHLEYSNEVWNWQFAQAAWADAQARARWSDDAAWVQFYALRASEVMDIWSEVFGAGARDRLVRIVATQTGWIGLEEQILNAPRVLAEGRPPPALSFDAYAVTAYVDGGLGQEDGADLLRGWLARSRAMAEARAHDAGLAGPEAAAFVARHRFDLALPQAAAEIDRGFFTGRIEGTIENLATTVLPHHAAVARRFGLRLVMYEGGSHLVGHGALREDAEVTAFLHALSYSEEMGALYRRLLAVWAAVSDAPFNAFTDVDAPTKWGAWGAMRHLGDDNPRWQALARGCGAC